MESLANTESRLTGQIQAKVKFAQQNLKTILASAAFKNPLLPIHNRQQQLDEITARLTEAMKNVLDRAKQKLATSFEKVVKIERKGGADLG